MNKSQFKDPLLAHVRLAQKDKPFLTTLYQMRKTRQNKFQSYRLYPGILQVFYTQHRSLDLISDVSVDTISPYCQCTKVTL